MWFPRSSAQSNVEYPLKNNQHFKDWIINSVYLHVHPFTCVITTKPRCWKYLKKKRPCYSVITENQREPARQKTRMKYWCKTSTLFHTACNNITNNNVIVKILILVLGFYYWTFSTSAVRSGRQCSTSFKDILKAHEVHFLCKNKLSYPTTSFSQYLRLFKNCK